MPKQVQHRGVQVVDVYRVLDRFVAQFVGGAVARAAAMPPPASHIEKPLHVMIAAVPLRHRRATEFAAVDDQRLVEHAALLQVADQGRGAAIHFGGRSLDVLLHAAVVIPIAMIELDEAYAALGQPTGQQAIRAERSVAPLRAVHFHDVGRLVRDIQQMRHAGLHAERHLVLADAGRDLGIVERSDSPPRSASRRRSTTSACRSRSTPGGLPR